MSRDWYWVLGWMEKPEADFKEQFLQLCDREGRPGTIEMGC